MAWEVTERAGVVREQAESRRHGTRARKAARSKIRQRCPELDCVRGWLSEHTIAAAEQRALQIDTGADRVLVYAGVVDEDIYLRLLTDSLGVAFEPLDDVPRTACPVDDERLIEAPAAGLLPLMAGGDLRLVVAPNGLSARRIIHLVRSRPELAKSFRLTTAARLKAFVTRHTEAAIGDRATNDLARKWREMSAAPPRWRPKIAPVLSIGAAVINVAVFAPHFAKQVCDVFLSLVFLSWMVLRIVGLLIGHLPPSKRGRLAERDLPNYTILVPLYREVRSIVGLIASLRQLDYPGIMAQTPQAVWWATA